MKHMSTDDSTAVRLARYAITAVLLLVPFHAFLTVWGSTFFGHFLWLRLWDEMLLAIICALVAIMLWRDQKFWALLIDNKLVRLIGVFAAINLIWGVISLAVHQVTLPAASYALVVNLRFFIWFIAIWLVTQRSSWLAQHWQKLVFWPAVVVIIFGLLQFFVWPPDILAHFGYSSNTYVPYITLNQDSSIVRIQSTLRGANGLGAYLAVVITLLAGVLLTQKRSWKRWLLWVGAGLTLVLTFSRSGWLAAVIGVVLVLVVRWRPKIHRVLAFSLLGCAGLAVVAGAALLKTNSDAQDLVYHVSDHTTASQTSNQQHASAFSTAATTMLREPLGRGPGSSGQASWYNTGHPVRNPESLLLQIGEETGWLGLGLFIVVLVELGRELWSRRQNHLALAMLASLVGITLISFVTYSWIDDTLAFIWWGLAAIALATPLAKH